MESKRGQKLSKATVATVLAASGVIVAMPQPSHAYSFEDLNPLADYYEPVLDLANRKIATGYSDGTFKPNQAITREDAAKMLALTIDVNITNPKNPGFKDVTTSNPNYRYIAALAELGIINGYSDKTFKPKEPITRGQMAKILTLGFKFGVSTKLNHGFKDVSNKNANSYFIQTLYDLNVTKGKTPIAFDPFNTVTRGQMATFIWRAEKADRGNPVYAVGDVIGDQIYINGVPHTIASHLRSILNAANKNILKDAQIEGDFSGNRINNISKLTINASGTSSRLLAMDGNYTSFSGELVVNGSYVRFKNITFTGRVEVAEAPRRSLADLSNMRVASVGNFAQFIDWSKPTVEKNEDFLNPIDKENLVEKPDPTKPNSTYKDRMANLKKYVDFEGSDIRHLYVTAERTFLKADYEIDRLYVQGNVANFELYASPNAMYIDTDYNVNIYGVHDIRYVYKNTLKNVHLRSDATYDNYYITSSNGFTNIGEHTYITNTIIPPNKTVNDVFDDFETDEPQIGHIEDENGKEVSRDPVGDTVIKDVTAPRITDLRVSAGGTLADVSLTADEDGTYYYVVKRADEKAPTINEIKTGGTKHSGNGPIVMDEPVKFQVTGLDTKIDYVIYAIVIDAADNVSEKEKAEFSTVDNKPPLLSLKAGDKMYGGKRLQFVVKKISEPGEVYYYIREKGSSSITPSVEDVLSKYTGKVVAATAEDLVITERTFGAPPAKGTIQPNTEYEIFATMIDKSGNKMRVVEPITIKTEPADEANPYIAEPNLVLGDRDKGYFYVDISEPLDKATAENPANYLLSGTGIVNITGHKEIKPVEVKLEGKRLRITIPAVTSLVKGDTIRLTVLKGVQDLAENEFENADTVPVNQQPRNYAEYRHSDDTTPMLNIKNIITGSDKYEVEVNTNKAGTYYYMILPSNYDLNEKGIKNRDFVDEFSLLTGVKTGKFQTDGKDDYVYKEGDKPATLGDFKFDIIKPSNLDPFTSYSIYMVLKDRSGQLSDIEKKPLISDAKPPLVSNVEVKNINNVDNAVKMTLNVDEKSNFYIIPIKKFIEVAGVRQLNTEYFNLDGSLKDIANTLDTTLSDEIRKDNLLKIGASQRKSSEGGQNIEFSIENLTPHEEYGFYIGVEDTIGNFTVRQRSASSVITNDEPSGSQMKYYAYTDGTKPSIENDKSKTIISNNEGIVVKNFDGTFTITFSEMIMREKDTNNTLLTESTNLSSILTIVGASTTGVPLTESDFTIVKYETNGTRNQSKLTIKPNQNVVVNQSLTIKMKDKPNAYDYDELNAFNLEILGKYVYPEAPYIKSKWVYLLEPYATDVDPTGESSRKISVDINSNMNISSGLRYYYASTIDKITLTPQTIINMVDSNIEDQRIFTAGKGTITTPQQLSDFIPVETTRYFKTGQYLHLIVIDDYGNVVEITNSADGTLGPIEITKFRP